MTETVRTSRRPRLGVVKFASCDGCQLTVLDLEDHLLDIAARFEIVEFAEATSRRSRGPFDILLVEGSISTSEQAEEIVRLREVSTMLVTIGACATSGGIQPVHPGCAGRAVPGPSDSNRLWSVVPGIRPRLLRLLWTARTGQYALARRMVCSW